MSPGALQSNVAVELGFTRMIWIELILEIKRTTSLWGGGVAGIQFLEHPLSSDWYKKFDPNSSFTSSRSFVLSCTWVFCGCCFFGYFLRAPAHGISVRHLL